MLVKATSTENRVVALLMVDPTDNDNLREPKVPSLSLQAIDVPEIQSVASQVVLRTDAVMVTESLLGNSPCKIRLIDPVCAPFPRVSTLIPPLCIEKPTVILPVRSPRVMDRNLLLRIPRAPPHSNEVSEDHEVNSLDVKPNRGNPV